MAIDWFQFDTSLPFLIRCSQSAIVSIHELAHTRSKTCDFHNEGIKFRKVQKRITNPQRCPLYEKLLAAFSISASVLASIVSFGKPTHPPAPQKHVSVSLLSWLLLKMIWLVMWARGPCAVGISYRARTKQTKEGWKQEKTRAGLTGWE